MKLAAILLVLLVLAAGAYVRLAPSDPSVWHVYPDNADPRTPDYSSPNSFLAHRSYPDTPDTILKKIDAAAQATARTRLVAGDITSGMVTYLTRSAIWGFPDYTTLIAKADDRGGTVLIVHGRARFGYSDLGVNKARVLRWLDALGIAPSA